MSQKEIDISKLLSTLCRGGILVKYCNGNFETKYAWINMKTKELCIARQQNEAIEEAVDIGCMREIRPGWRCMDDMVVVDQALSFTVLHGYEFNLDFLYITVGSKSDYDLWLKGLSFLNMESKKLPYITQQEKWLQKEFSKIDYNKQVSLKDIKQWFLQINAKIPANKMKDIFQNSSGNSFNYDGFKKIYASLMMLDSVFKIGHLSKFENANVVSMNDLKDFFITQQKDVLPLDACKLFLYTLGKSSPENILKTEFIDFLFSKENDIFDPAQYKVNQNMDLPMTNYWIASSHNTYLTGHQLKGLSSIETYARVLRSGCRCVELDCWDGPNGYPIIYHGHTLTTKINFIDVIKIIKEEAWVKSEYPLILSIENHCTIPQQRIMAQAFRDIFGKDLLTELVPTKTNQMPSPNELKRKIIIKNKKLPGNEASESVSDESNDIDTDTNRTVKRGIVYIKDIYELKWVPFYFDLSSSRLTFNELLDENEAVDTSNLLTNLEDEPWYHYELIGDNGRIQCEKLIKEFSIIGDGTFLIRHGKTKDDLYRLSFWLNNQVNHCKISTKIINGKTQYYLLETNLFENLQKLIYFYTNNPIHTLNFKQILTFPIPKHYLEEWYYEKLTREEAEAKLKKVCKDGAFLIRKKLNKNEVEKTLQYIISFRAAGNIHHSPINLEDQQFVIGSASFSSLSKIVCYYKKTSLYKKIKLRTAVTEKLLNRLPNNRCARALYDFTATSADQLSFPKNAIITNVEKKKQDWWTGNYNKVCNNFFPSNYVEEIINDESRKIGNLEHGYLDLNGVIIEEISDSKKSSNYFRLIRSDNTIAASLVKVTDESEFKEWIQCFKDCSRNVEQLMQEMINNEKTAKIARELSDLIIYCIAVPFKKAVDGNIHYTQMFSINETNALKQSSKENSKQFIGINRKNFSRIYPKGNRFDSSNYDPMPMWNCGSHFVALNYQTPDRSMQLNMARFLMNGQCGYVLQPECMQLDNFNPYDRLSVVQTELPLTYKFHLIAARHLPKKKNCISSPYIEIEVVGCEYDNAKFKSNVIVDNGLNPQWMETCQFDIINPDMALILFSIMHQDMFGDPYQLAQAGFPVKCLRKGFRSIHLKNEFCERLPLSTLLVNLEISSVEIQNTSEHQQLQGLLKFSHNIIEEMQVTNDQEKMAELQADYEKGENEIAQIKATIRAKNK